MRLNGRQREILRVGILGAYPTEDELEIILLEKMDLNLKAFNRGETYNIKVFNLITKLEADGKLKNFIQIIINQKPNSPYLNEVKSEFQEIIEENNEVKLLRRYALVVSIDTYNSLGKPEATTDGSEAISQEIRLRRCAQLLETYGEFHVSRLPETKDIPVTQSQLKKALAQLFKLEGKSVPETALLYFSGRGLKESLGVAQSSLATSDSDPDEDKWGISLKWLRELLIDSPVREQIIWLDCCGENLNFNEANPGEQEGKSRCFIVASGNFELTKVLREGLDPTRYQQKEVTNKSLTAYIKEHLQGVTQSASFTNFGEAIALTRLTSGVDLSTVTPPTDTGICPYKGLRYFDCNEEDPKYFHGRDGLTDQLLDKVRQSNFLAIVGQSGSGKSSVMRAGLLHQMKQGEKLAGSGEWKIQIMVTGEQPLQCLARAFVDSTLLLGIRTEELERIKRFLEKGSKGLEQLIEASEIPRLVIVIDKYLLSVRI